MHDRTRVRVAVAGTIGLFVCIQLGALALVEPFVAADYQPVEDPSDPRNSLLFFGAVLLATGVMLAAIKLGRQRIVRWGIVLACGTIGWYVFGVFAAPLAAIRTGVGPLNVALSVLPVAIPAVAGLAMVAGLLYHPEWYVLDAAGIVIGAGAAGLLGTAFGPLPAILFLVVLAVYDAVSVYGTEHMLTLAEGVMDMRVPALLVVPTRRSYSIVADGETEAEDSSPATGAEPPDETALDRGAGPEGTFDERGIEDSETTSDRDAIYIGLGDAVMPSILVASAAVSLRETVPSLGVPWLALNLPALTAMIGTIAGLVVLLWLVLKGRAHAGLPLLNGGAILGYLLGALASGLTLVEAVGLPM